MSASENQDEPIRGGIMVPNAAKEGVEKEFDEPLLIPKRKGRPPMDPEQRNINMEAARQRRNELKRIRRQEMKTAQEEQQLMEKVKAKLELEKQKEREAEERVLEQLKFKEKMKLVNDSISDDLIEGVVTVTPPKPRGRKPKPQLIEEDDDVTVTPPKPRGRKPKPQVIEDDDVTDTDEEIPEPPKLTRSRKIKPQVIEDDDDIPQTSRTTRKIKPISRAEVEGESEEDLRLEMKRMQSMIKKLEKQNEKVPLLKEKPRPVTPPPAEKPKKIRSPCVFY
jgi:hypothetical protein